MLIRKSLIDDYLWGDYEDYESFYHEHPENGWELILKIDGKSHAGPTLSGLEDIDDEYVEYKEIDDDYIDDDRCAMRGLRYIAWEMMDKIDQENNYG